MMKKLMSVLVVVAMIGMMSSCGVSEAYLQNQTQYSTQVHLSKNNYMVGEMVTGSSEADYVFMIGGIRKKQLFANARAELIKNANLGSGSKALSNLVIEEHFSGFFPFYVKRTVTASAHVIEFTN